ncbi:MAG: WD40 repeat domain-containing serine/threonine protein kinase [Planctomycetota bacterium]
MEKGEFQRVSELFTRVRRIKDPARRDALLADQCEDSAIRREVERLLEHDAEGAGLGARISGAVDQAAARSAQAGVPESIDSFRIIRRISTGGMGTVFEAQQSEPRRRVALKLLRADVVSEESLRRFELEAHVLGSLQHPAIAQVYASGRFKSPSGTLPYIAMEYVDGLRLTRYAQIEQLGVRERVELLIEVCDAIQHAHHNGVIHRDLKPANVLVDRRGRPKVLDFGVSRAADRGRPDSLGLTRTGNVIGTLGYMSPEQAVGSRNVDTRADVYALGVLGYELLAGRVPHDISELPLPQALRVLHEQPAPPLESIDRRLAGDLSIIFGKALELEPERRYPTATALAADLRRYLNDEPIEARPATLTYQLSRFVRRHRVLVSAMLLTFLGLGVGLVFALRSQKEESRQRARADLRAVEAERSAYAVRMQAAGLYFANHDAATARVRMESTDPAQRGWEWRFLDNALRQDLADYPTKLVWHPQPSFSADARYVAAAVSEQSVRVFDFEAGAWGAPIAVGPKVSVVAVANDGRLFWGDRSGRVFLDGREIGSYGAMITGLCMLPDQQRLAVGTSAPAVFAVSPETGRANRIGEPSRSLYALCFAPDGRELAGAIGRGDVGTVTPDGQGRLFKRRSWGHYQPFPVATRVAYSPDGANIACNDRDQRVVLWSTRTDEVAHNLYLRDDLARDVQFHPDGRSFLTAHGSSGIRHWDLKSGRCIALSSGSAKDPIMRFAIAGGRIHAVGTAGALVRSAAPDRFQHVLRGHKTIEEIDHLSYVYDVDFSPDGRRMVSAGWVGDVILWDVATTRVLASVEGHNNDWVRFTEDGARILTLRANGTRAHLRVWNPVTGTIEAKEALRYFRDVPSAAFTGFGLAVGAERLLQMRDAASLAVRRETTVPANIASLDADGKRIAYGMIEGGCAVVDARDFRLLLKMEVDTSVTALAFSPDGKRLVAGGGDGTVRLWNIGESEPAWRVTIDVRRRSRIYSLRFSRDGRRVAVGSRMGEIEILDAANGQNLLQLAGHTSYVKGLDFSPDGAVLASASGDNTVRLWHTRPASDRAREAERMLALEAKVRPRVEALLAQGPERIMELIAAEFEGDERHAAENVAYLSGE